MINLKMKKLFTRQKLVPFTLLIGIAILFFNCERDADEFGKDFLSSRDSVPVVKDTFHNFSTFLEPEPEFATNGTNKLIIGNITDEYFGQTKSYGLGQYFINTVVDSGTTIPPEDTRAEIIIKPENYFGDFEEIDISIYEVDQSIDVSEEYFSSENPEDYYSNPKISEDSISFQGDSIIKIPLTSDFTQKLNEYSFETVDDTLIFTEAIKGLLFSMEGNTGGNEFISVPIENCMMHLYYTETTDTSDVTDTVDYNINSDFGVRFNMFEHDYSQATSTPNANTTLESEGEDSLLFIQNLQGTRAKVSFNKIDSIKEENEGKLIANASLIFDVKDNFNQLTDTTESNMTAYIYREDSTYNKLNNYVQSIVNYELQTYEAYFDDTNNEMVFNITGYFQSLLNDRIENETIYLHTSNRDGNLKQIVLTGRKSSSSPRLEVTYYNTSE
ncbi:MAG: hypothetical protein ACQESJ_06715 [Bacteroidota bacterium]